MQNSPKRRSPEVQDRWRIQFLKDIGFTRKQVEWPEEPNTYILDLPTGRLEVSFSNDELIHVTAYWVGGEETAKISCGWGLKTTLEVLAQTLSELHLRLSKS